MQRFDKKKIEIADIGIPETPTPLELANVGNGDTPTINADDLNGWSPMLYATRLCVPRQCRNSCFGC